MTEISKRKGRGRPAGSAPTYEADHALLIAAARRIHYGLSHTATAAFRELLDEDDAKFKIDLRRLQHRWQTDKLRYLREVARQAAEQSNFQFESLSREDPEIAKVIQNFAMSQAGQAFLARHGREGVPAQLMSFGLKFLWDEICRISAIGPDRADELFEPQFARWCSTGAGVDATFLRRFAELCLARADDLPSTNLPIKSHPPGSAVDPPADDGGV